jgi:hypothetical protein
MRLLVSKLLSYDSSYIGDIGDVFWDVDTNSLRRSDGVTVGGVPVIPDFPEIPVIPEIVEKGYINYFDFDNGSTTTFPNSNTWVKLNTTTTSNFSRNGFVHTNNRVTNSGSTKIVKLEGIGSVISAQGSLEIHMAFFKDGQLISCSEQSTYTVTHGNNSYASAIPFQCITELQTGSFIEVYVKNSTNSNSIILQNVNVILMEL